jgi:hypothetical protein
MSKWLSYCGHCGKNTTLGPMPGSPSYEEVVSCNLCSMKINAGRGRPVRMPNVHRKEKKDLLKV